MSYTFSEASAVGRMEPTASVNFEQDHIVIHTSHGNVPFQVELAKTVRQQEYGYMHRSVIPDGQGMLFLMPKDKVISMWMKNTPLSLDMLFIKKNGKIMRIIHSAIPNSETILSYPKPVRAVLELPGGTAATKAIHPGDVVVSSYFKEGH